MHLVSVSLSILLVNVIGWPSCSCAVPMLHLLELICIVMVFFSAVLSEACMEELVADPCF